MSATYPQGRRSACHAKALGTPIDKRLKEKFQAWSRKANVLRHVQTAPHVLHILQHPCPDVAQGPSAEI